MNPYEIRLELLKMAKEMMDVQHAESSNAYYKVLEEHAKNWNQSVDDLVKYTQDIKPTMYQPKEMMEKAQELYNFVSYNRTDKK